jgi:Lar family restriction alleviation protein
MKIEKLNPETYIEYTKKDNLSTKFKFDIIWQINELIDAFNSLNQRRFITTNPSLTDEMIAKWNDGISNSRIKEEEKEADLLLPCPFCASLDIEYLDHTQNMCCSNCGAEGPDLSKEAEDVAFREWNRRAK